MRVRLQTLFLVMTWLAVAFAVLGPRLAKWWAAEPPQVAEDSQTIVLKPRCEGVESLAFSADGKFLASIHTYLEVVGQGDSRSSRLLTPTPNFVMLWDVRERVNLARFQVFGHCQEIRSTRDGKKLVIGSDGKLMFWDIKDQVFQQSKITDVYEISPDGSLVVTYGESGGMIILNSEDSKVVAKLPTGEDAEAWAVSPDSTLLAVGYRWSKSDRVEIWDLTQKKVQATLLCNISSKFCARFSPDGKLFAFASIDGKDASVFDTETGKLRGKFGSLRGPVWCLAFSPSGKTLAVGGEVGEVHWWDVATGGHHDQNGFGSSWGVTAVAFSPDGTRLAIGDGDGNIKLLPVAE